MTADPTELALHRLEAERLRGSRDETPADPWMELIHLLANPGPADPAPDLTEETTDHA